MRDDLDLERVARIPDPFADHARSYVPRLDMALRTDSATRQQRGRLRAIAAAGALVYEVSWVALVERRTDLGSVSASRLALGLLIPLIACALALSAATRGGPRGLGPAAMYVAACASLAPVFFAVATLIVAPPDANCSALAWWHDAVPCLGVTGLLTAGALALGAFGFRRAFVSASAWRTAALGVSCGALSVTTMSLACSNGGAFHVVVAHGGMMIVGGIAGALLARFVTRA